MATEQGTEPKERNIGYTFLDMRHGEDLLLAEKRIKQVAEKHPTEFYFDILHTNNQTPKAMGWFTEIEAMIATLADLPEEAITLNLNTDERTLRSKAAIYKKAIHSGSEVQEKELLG